MEPLCFTSTRFAVEPGEDDETNPGVFGRQLAAWLVAELKNLGYREAEAIPEDWGWCVRCPSRPFALWIGCSNAGTEEREANGEPIAWRCFVEAEVPILKRLFAKPDTGPAKAKLQAELAQLLSADASVRWLKCP